MTRSHRKLIFLAAAGAFALGIALPTAEAALAGPEPESAAAPSPIIGDAAVPPGLDSADRLIDEATFEEVAAITERITPYLYVGDDGLVQLRDVSADELGVSEQFLRDFRAAMTFSNRAIADGHIVVNDDLTVTTSEAVAAGSMPSPGLVGGASPLVGGGPSGLEASAGVDAAPGNGTPEWGAWRYPQGAIFYNSHTDWTYYRNAYYGLCNTMAAYLGYPWLGQPLIYFYGYNQLYMNRFCYSGAGMYWYMPYSYCGLGLGYKPAYFWGRTYGYNYGCRCYQYQWAWQGVWCRY